MNRLAAVLTGINIVLLAALLWHGRTLTAQAVPDVLRARSLEIVDANGSRRLQVTTEPDGEAILRMRDRSGTIRVKLGAGDNGSGLLLLDGATEPGLHVLVTRRGTSLTLKSGEAETVLRPQR